MGRGRSLTSTIPSVGSGTYSPGPNMARSPDEEGSNEECRCHHGPGLPRPQKPCYSVGFLHYMEPLNYVSRGKTRGRGTGKRDYRHHARTECVEKREVGQRCFCNLHMQVVSAGVLRKRRQFFQIRGQSAGRYTTAGHFLGSLPACIILCAVRTGCCGLGKVFVRAFEPAVDLAKGTTREQQNG